MWRAITCAKSKGDLKRALYIVCCRIQELEARVEGRWAGHDCCGERSARPFSVRWNEGKRNPDFFTVVLCHDENLWILRAESQPEAELVCRRLNKLLTGRIAGLKAEG